MIKSEKALTLFDQGFNCSQSVFSVFCEDFGLKENDCLKISCAFGGGMGRRQLTCGAVTGALMVIGMKFGKAKGDDNARKINTYEKTNEFLEAFTRLNGTINCRELLQGLDMNDPEDSKKIESLGLFKTSCKKYIRDAVETTQKLISTD